MWRKETEHNRIQFIQRSVCFTLTQSVLVLPKTDEIETFYNQKCFANTLQRIAIRKSEKHSVNG